MTIAIVISIIIILSFFVDRKYLKTYFIFAAFVLSMLYFFARPDIEADYYRHLVFLRSLKNISWEDIFSMRARDYGYWITDLYIPRYPGFCIYSKIMSALPENLYVIPACFVLYVIPIKFIFKENQTENKLASILAYSFYLMCINFVSISAIRNIFVAVAFCFVLYEELVEKKNKIVCWICYGLLCLIHSYGFLLLFFRLLLLITNRFTKYVIAVFALIAYGVVVNKVSFVTELLKQFGGSSVVSLLNAAIDKGVEYTAYLSDDRWKLKVLALFFYCLEAVFILIYYRCSDVIHEKRNTGYRRMLEFYLYFLLFTISAYSQYDIFTRGGMFMIPLTGIFVTRFYNELMSFHGVKIRLKKQGAFMGFIVVMMLMSAMFTSYVLLQYRWVNGWWT